MLDKLKFWKKEDDFMTEPADPMMPQDPMMQSPTDSMAQDPFGQLPGQAPPGQDPMAQPTPQVQDHVRQNFGEEQHMNSFGAGNAQYAQEQEHEPERNRDTELILAKLDAIKAELDSVHQRVKSLENKEQKRSW